MERDDFTATVLWWTGMLLLAAYATLFVALPLLFPCHFDCDDGKSHAGVLFMWMFFAPLWMMGLGMAAGAVKVGRPRGAPPLMVRVVLSAGWLTLAGAAAVLLLLAFAAVQSAGDMILTPFFLAVGIPAALVARRVRRARRSHV